MGFLLVMKAEIVRSWIIMRRYWFRTLTGIFLGYGMLMVLIAGFMYSRTSIEGSIEQLGDPVAATNFVLGFIIGMYAFGVVGMFSQGIQSMAGTGILEQLCMSPHGLIANFMARTAVGSVTMIASSGVMVWLVTLSVGGRLYFDPLAVLVLLALTFVNLLGFGFMVGGLVLVFKQVGQLAVLIRMVLFGLAIFAQESILEKSVAVAGVMHALPITDAAICLKYVLIHDQGRVDGAYASVFTHPCFFWLLVSCTAWTFAGVTCFRVMEDHSRTKGTLGAY
jgi:ABC-type polysaccharide/polyol phosphate export permease